ncbi:MAG TPA: hypothetical protein VIJ50_01865 [Solirubrobacteraceae bacterium]
MSKLRIVFLILFAACALNAVLAVSAYAEEEAEMLLNGVAIKSGVEAEISSTMLLEDMNAPVKVDVLCSWLFVVDYSNPSLGYYILVLDLAKTEEVPLDCEASPSGTCENNLALVTSIHLAWHYELLRRRWMLLEDEETKPGEPGFEVLCQSSLLGDIKDTCTGPTEAELSNVTGGVELNFSENEEITPAVNCTLGGTKSGLIAGKGLMTPIGGGTLTLS